jgi:hypothetical protein
MAAGGDLDVCPTCAGGLTRAAWQKLPLAQKVAAATIVNHVSAWPSHANIEVRRCRDCAREIARTVLDPR